MKFFRKALILGIVAVLAGFFYWFFEVKKKSGLMGAKDSFPLPPFDLDEELRPTDLVDVLAASDIPDWLRARCLFLEPTLLNRYRRKYFRSADGDYRITVDSSQVADSSGRPLDGVMPVRFGSGDGFGGTDFMARTYSGREFLGILIDELDDRLPDAWGDPDESPRHFG